MNEFLKTLLSLSLSGTLLFLLVLLPRGLYKERFSRRWQYYILLVAALRFLLPFAPGVNFTGYLFHRAEAAISAAEGNVSSSASGLPGGAQTPDGPADHIDGKPAGQADSAGGSSNGLADSADGSSNGRADSADGSSDGLADSADGNSDGLADSADDSSNGLADSADDSSNGLADYPGGIPDGPADHAAENSNGWEAADTRRPNALNTAASLAALMARLKNLPYLQTGLFSLWLTAAAALLIRKVTAYQSFLGFLKAASTQVSDIEVLNLLSDCMERLHISGKVDLYTNPLIASPILTGFFRPRIILPCRQGSESKEATPTDAQQQTISTAMSASSNSIPEIPTGMPERFTGTLEASTGTPEIRKKDLSYIFIHELIHYRRRDMFCKWFIQLILCVHWFNPFVYLLVREVGRACELACDESVVAGLDDAEKKAYGNTLLAFLQTGNACKNPLASVTLAEGARELKERLGAIMKTHKTTKSVPLLTVLATAAICTAFCTLGAYAKSDRDNPAESTASAPNRTEHPGNTETPGSSESPAADNALGSGSADSATDSRSLADSTASLPDGASYQQDGNIYYIYTEGTDRSAKPLAGFTDGTIGVVLVRKGSYTSLGPFDRTADAEDFLDEITRLCQDMTDSNKITQQDALLILALADIIKDRFPDLEPDRSAAVSYTFVQRGYYQDSFIIELGWNLSAGGQIISQARRTAATLEDGSRMNVYFADAAREYANDSEALAAVSRLIDSLRKNNLKGYPDLETPLVSSIRKVDGSNLPALAREFMANQDLTGFSAVFPALDAQAQEECCQALYEDADVAFFASIAPFLEEDMLLSFLDRADEDGNMSFFTAMLITGSVPADRLSENYAEKYYENDDISSFSAIVSFLPEKEQRRFLEKARKDQKSFFQKVLSDALAQSASAAPSNTTNSISNSPDVPDSLMDSGTIVYEGADIRFYEDNSPYLRDILINRTDRTVTETEFCILAYDSQGHPLQLQWNFMDSSAKAAYDNLTRRTGLRLGPNQTTEAIPGGWSLSDKDAARISYTICCLKKVVFEDGTAWSNPDYEDWHETYAGKEIAPDELEDYYPREYLVKE